MDKKQIKQAIETDLLRAMQSLDDAVYKILHLQCHDDHELLLDAKATIKKVLQSKYGKLARKHS